MLQNLHLLTKASSGKAYSKNILDTQPVKEVMTSELYTVKSSDPIEYAVELLLQKRFRCLPVVENEKAVGIITSFDLLKGYYQEHG